MISIKNRVLFQIGVAVFSTSLFSAITPTDANDGQDDNWNSYGSGDTILIEAGIASGLLIPGLDSSPSEDGTYWTVAAVAGLPPSVPSGCLGQIQQGQWADDDCPLIGPLPADTDPEENSFTPPSTADILYQALATAHVSPAGLAVQPADWSYTGVPTLVHALDTEQTLTVTVLGYTVPIRLHADSFAFDFQDGNAPLVTADPGAPWPDTTNQHTYTTAAGAQTISLITTWAATVTNPFTGETLSVPGIIQTRETSSAFEVRTSHTVVTDTAEHLQGH